MATQTISRFYSSGELRNTKSITDGKPSGIWTVYYKSGGVKVKSIFGEDNRVTHQLYYENGDIQSFREQIGDTVVDGKSIDWYPPELGHGVKFIYNYKMGQFHGNCKRWTADGKVEFDNNYIDGKRHGNCKWIFNKRIIDDNYVNGSKHGTCKELTIDGQLLIEREYIDGKLQGSCKNRLVNGV